MEFMKLYDKKSKSQKMKFQTVSYFYWILEFIFWSLFVICILNIGIS
jgi:hypothetical protein